MIPRRYINEWRENVNWNEDIQVEQDLIITRALIAIYNDESGLKTRQFSSCHSLHI